MRKYYIFIILLIIGTIFYYLYQWTGNPTERVIQTILPPAESQNKNGPTVTTIANGLEIPWAIAFLPTKEILITERPGRIRIINAEGQLNPKPLATIPVKTIGEGGLLGIAVDPDFSINNFIYIYYTYDGNSGNTVNRVVRYTLVNQQLQNTKILVDAIPGSQFHNGGRILFGPDDYLYITTGDAQDPSQAQDKASLAGKILRVTRDGKPATNNPFKNKEGHSFVYSYGHRNPQGLAWDAQGNLWETEHGRSNPTGFDEINFIEPGKNYGWPEIQGDETETGMLVPKSNSGPTTPWAPASAVFIGDSLFFGGLRGQTLYEAVVQNDQVTEIKKHFSQDFGRIRDVVLGPDNMLYITTSNRDGRGIPLPGDDKVIRINPQKL